MNKIIIIALAFMLSSILAGCSIKKIALTKVAGALTAEGGTVFTGDNDPELIADALPFALKTYESLLEALPEDQDLLIATGKAFCMYSFAFIHSAADTMSDVRIEAKQEKLQRAKKMYLRAKGYLFRAWDLRYPAFRALIDSNKTDSALSLATLADTTLLYWTGASWMGAFTADKFDMTLAVDMMKPVAFMKRLLALKEDYGDGAVHEFFISYYGSMPESMGGSEEKSRTHYKRALEISKGAKAGPYVSLATSVCVGKQYADEFKALLDSALAVDIDASPQNRLANILSQRKAKWLLTHMDNYFLLDEPADEEPIEEEEMEEE